MLCPTVNLANSILAGTANGATDFASATIDTGANTFVGTGNLIQNNAGSGNGFLTGAIVSSDDPEIGPLADNGGPTKTMAPLTGSPAIDAGDNTPDAPPFARPSTDQRGLMRIVNGTIDIGAVELQSTAPPPGAETVANFTATAGGVYTIKLSPAPNQQIEILDSSGNVLAQSPVGSTPAVAFTNTSGQPVQLVIDSGKGAIPAPITFDGGAGSGSSLVLQGGTAASDTYAPGPNGGQGVDTLVIGGVTETVSFVNLTPVYDSVAGDLTVTGTGGNDSISYVEGNDTTGAPNPVGPTRASFSLPPVPSNLTSATSTGRHF